MFCRYHFYSYYYYYHYYYFFYFYFYFWILLWTFLNTTITSTFNINIFIVNFNSRMIYCHYIVFWCILFIVTIRVMCIGESSFTNHSSRRSSKRLVVMVMECAGLLLADDGAASSCQMFVHQSNFHSHLALMCNILQIHRYSPYRDAHGCLEVGEVSSNLGLRHAWFDPYLDAPLRIRRRCNSRWSEWWPTSRRDGWRWVFGEGEWSWSAERAKHGR